MTGLAAEFQAVLAAEPVDLAAAALLIARLEYPRLDPRPSMNVLDSLGRRAADVIDEAAGLTVRARVARLNALLFADEGFAGNRAHYDDFRNSLLNVVLDRRLGIPITLGLVYMEVARRAGLHVAGIAFPGHFLLSAPGDGADGVILDPFSSGQELDEDGCRRLLARAMGDAAAFHPDLLRPCSPRDLLLRMLHNLKRTYVELQSFHQARRVTDLLLAGDPTTGAELRDRGLLSYRLDDYPAALRDLESYLRLSSRPDDSGTDERREIWEHVKTLRRRVAGMN
jgi:regulator of sirC expression with transglutaminase-like and TPR domain